MKGKLITLGLLLIMIFLICGCAGNIDGNSSSTNVADWTSSFTDGTSTTEAGEASVTSTTKSQNAGFTKKTQSNAGETKDNEQVSEFIEIVKTPDSLQKTGDNKISDSPKNTFISYIAEEYDVDPEWLVAIYAVPDNGNNFVLEFKKSYDEDGKPIRSTDTLYKVYKINKDKSVTVACDDIKYREGVSYWESYFCLISMQTMIMPQHPDYFTLDK